MEYSSEESLEQSIGYDDIASLAYIKPLSAGGEAGHGIFSAGGEQLAVFQTYETAFFTARKYNLAPVSVH